MRDNSAQSTNTVTSRCASRAATVCSLMQIRFRPAFTALVLGLLMQAILVAPSVALTRINDDVGGSHGEYLLIFARLRDSGDRVAIDGRCFSPCTLVTA